MEQRLQEKKGQEQQYYQKKQGLQAGIELLTLESLDKLFTGLNLSDVTGDTTKVDSIRYRLLLGSDIDGIDYSND